MSLKFVYFDLMEFKTGFNMETTNQKVTKGRIIQIRNEGGFVY
ncbi:hypothetical protein [Clostridium luticellarii]|nr:hypothetical protein [Clostridium luticellarii]